MLPSLVQPSGRGMLGTRNFSPKYVKANMVVLDEYLARVLCIPAVVVSSPLSLFLFPGFYTMFSPPRLLPTPCTVIEAISILELCIHDFNNKDSGKHNGSSQASHGRNFAYPAQIILKDLISRGLDYMSLLAHLECCLPRFGPLSRECFWAVALAFRRYRLHLQAPPVETDTPIVQECCTNTTTEEDEEDDSVLWKRPLSDDDDEVVEVDSGPTTLAVANRRLEEMHTECVKSPWHCSARCNNGHSSRCYGRRSKHDEAMFSLAAIVLQRWFRSPSYYYRKFDRTRRRKRDQVAAKIMKLEVIYHTDCIMKLQEKWENTEVFDPAREELLPEGWITGTFPGEMKRWYKYGTKEESRSTGRRRSNGEEIITTLHPLFDKSWTVQPVTWTDKKY